MLAVCGDGGFAMSIHALMTAVQAGIAITVVVFNNNALGWVLHGMGEKAVAAGFDEFDHAAIARSVGCDGVRVTSTDELREASVFGRPSGRSPFVIDVPTSLKTSFKRHRPVPGRWPLEGGASKPARPISRRACPTPTGSG